MSATRLPPDATAPAPTLIGRERQLAGIARAVARVRAGRAQFVLIEGESGFGKTALLRAGVETVPLWPLRAAVADEHEADLPYGVLNQLLAEVDDQDQLEPVLHGGISPDVPPMVAGAALLTLIDTSEGATCVTIDDAQWMDQRSAEAL
ncbi:MAG: ATP-binding protein, partial [Mycetocola sp.]